MTGENILLDEIIGKTITDIRCKFGKHDGWPDTAECFIEIDRNFYIQIPYGQADSVLVTLLDPAATTIFGDLSDIAHFHVNSERKSIAEVAESHKTRKKNIFGTGYAGLHYYDSLITLKDRKGDNLNRYTQNKKPK
jgi:hypothetical protein